MVKFFTFIFLILSWSVVAQQTSKKTLTFDDYAGWNNMENYKISDNGMVITYEINPQKGDGMLVIHHSGIKDTIKRGSDAQLDPDGNFVIFKIKQPEEKIRKAKVKKVKKDQMPSDSLGIYIFRHDSILKFAEVKSFKIPEENADILAFTVKAITKKDTSKVSATKKKIEQPGDDFILMDMTMADTMNFHRITEFHVAKKGGWVYFISQKKDTAMTYSKVQAFNVINKTVDTVFDSEGWARELVTDPAGNQFGFLHSADTIKEKNFKLFYGNSSKNAEVLVDDYTSGIPIGWSPAEKGNINFSEDGTKIYFGTAKTPEPEPRDTLLDEEKPKLDVWNWKDLTLQPQQKVNVNREKERTYAAVYHIDLKKMVQLTDLNVRNLNTIQKGNSNIALGSDDLPYLRASSWTGEQNQDYYLIDLVTGNRRLMTMNSSYTRLSPAGKFVIWYDQGDSSYYAKSTSPGQKDTVALTRLIQVSFYNEWHDSPSSPRPYGVAGWALEDRFVFIYDRYDIWKIDPTGEKVPVNMTKGFGRRNKIRLRYLRLDRDEEFIPMDKETLLEAFDERTMSSGFFKTTFGAVKDPKLLVMDEYSFSNPIKAKNTNILIWTKQDVQTFPDLWTSNFDFERPVKLSDANPQQKNYNWSTVELLEWTSFSGEKLQGLLYKPENFDPSLKYPVIVYFYERNAETLHSHYIPSPSRSTVNKTFYPSNGYLIFIPDITYKTGYPGQSAYNAIVSGTHFLINTFKYIDKNRLGLQGQSWGGYQTVYLITQTDMFAAAMGGAPVANMTSAYGGIRWQTGMSRMFQYEHTQSRIGGTLWEKPMLYIENSPLFHAPKINTPLLMMHNDDDGAVPWYQGIEMFVAMRRLDKPVWMLTYNGEPHNLNGSSWANRVDLSKRMFQFFNHYLKGQSMPEWMEKGIPAVDKGKTWGY